MVTDIYQLFIFTFYVDSFAYIENRLDQFFPSCGRQL